MNFAVILPVNLFERYLKLYLFVGNKMPEFQRQGLHSKIFDNFIVAVLKIIDKLDFSLMEDGVEEPSVSFLRFLSYLTNV